MIGETVSHYKIISKLGEGGMGVVYKAEDTKLKRIVALKFLPQELTRDKDAKKRFVHEAQAASALQHNNICAIHEIDETGDGQMFICMDYYEGETLKERIGRGPLPVAEALDVARRIAGGLAKAHGEGTVHRDIKPANVMVTSEGVVKIVDFGLAKLAGRTRVTKTGTTVGTVAYMSPEQARGEGVDHRTDIWSLGVIIYEMLTGQSPFTGDHEQAVTYQIVHEDPEPVTALRTGVPMELERIVNKCLEKKPSDRYQHVDELVVDLRKVKRASTPKPKKNLFKYAVVTLAVVILGVTMWKLLWQHGAVSPAEDMAVAVVDFRDLGTPNDATASAGIASLVQVGLVESSPCRVVSPQYLSDLRRRLFGAARGPIEEGQALEVARKSGATMLLSGQIVMLSANPYITWQLVDTTNGKSLGAKRLEGENLALLADQIIADVLPLLANECGVEEPTLPPPVSTLTTASPQAYRHYVAGVLASEEARPEEAERELEHAVRLDSTFALALFELAKAPDAEDPGRDRAYADRAWGLRTRLGIKDRLRLEAYRQQLDWHHGDAFGTYREMLARWPDDREVLRDLVLALWSNWHFNEVIPVAEKGLALYPDDLSFGLSYGAALGTMGRLEEALEWDRVYIERHPGTANAWDELGLRYLSLGLPDSAETAFRQALEIDPNFFYSQGSLARCQYHRGDVNGAIETWQQILAQRELLTAQRVDILFRHWHQPSLSFCYAEVGRFEKALERLEEARQYVSGPDRELMPDWARSDILLRTGREEEALHWARALAERSKTRYARAMSIERRGRALAALDSLDAARSVVAELRAPEYQHNGLVRFQADRITVKIALAEGNPEKALASLDQMKRNGVPFGGLVDIEFREALSRAHLMAGRLDEAANVHEEMLRVYSGHALSHYELGKIYQDMGRPADARREFSGFLEMWSEADEGLPQVADAQQRLNALGGGSQ